MSSGSAPLNGSGPQEIWISVSRTGQSYSGNYSTYQITVKYLAKGWGSWSGSTQYWSANAGGETWSGTFVIGSPGTSDITLLSDTWNRSHNSSGYGSSFTATAAINTDHSSIGDGSVSVTESAAPRIPKPPAQQGAPTISNIAPTSMTVKWPASTNNNGAAIERYQLQRATNSAFTTGVSTSTFGASTLQMNVTGLTPSTSYWYRDRAENSQGWGAWSSSTQTKTLSGFYVWNGSAWKPGEALVWNGTAWVSGEVFIWDGTAWVPAS